VFAGLSALTGAVTAAVAVWTALQIRTTTEQTERAIGHIADLATSTQTEATALHQQLGPLVREATAAEHQAVSADQSLSISRRTFMLGERAWIAIAGITVQGTPAIGERIRVLMDYQNTGRSPAADLNIAQQMSYVDTHPVANTWGFSNPKVTLCDNIRPLRGGETVFPGRVSQTFIPPELQTTYSERLLNHRAILVWQGCFAYTTLGQAHVTRFCYWLRPEEGAAPANWTWNPCYGENSAD